jgi:hypothetical protein
MINESGFDGVCYDDKAVFWHSGSLLLSAITDCPNLKMRTFRDWVVGQFEKTARWVALVGHARVPLTQPLLPSSHDCPVEPFAFVPVVLLNQAQGGLHMMKIAFAVAAAAAVLTTAPLVTPAKAQGVKMAQGVDVQIGRDRDDRYDRDRRGRYDSDTTVGLGPGGVTIGPRQRCRMETTTIERDDGRTITRRERRCD